MADQATQPVKRAARLLWALVTALCISTVAFAFFWRLREVPSNITGDEVTYLNDVLRIIQAPDKVSPLSFMGDGSQSGFNFYPMAWLSRLFSEADAVLAMRLDSVLIGLGVLAAFYLYVRTKVNFGAAALATLLLGTNYVFLNFSRATWMGVGRGAVLILGLLSFYFVERAARRQQWRWMVLAGVFSGLTLYGYIWAAALPAASLLYLGYVALRKRLPWKTALAYGAVLFSLTALVATPFFLQIRNDYDRYTLRTKSVFIYDAARPYYGQSDMPGILWHQATYTVRGFLFLDPGVSTEGVENQRYVPRGEGPVDPVTRVLFFASLGAVLLFHRKNIVLPALALAGVLLATQVLTQVTPNIARGIFALVFIYVLLAVFLDWLLTSRRYRPWLPAAVTLLALGLGWWNTWHYFQWGESKELASSRQPAIQYGQVPLWVETQKKHIQGGQYDLTITSKEWQLLLQTRGNGPGGKD